MINQLTNQELFHFCQQFSILIKAGISVIEALDLLSEESRQKETKELLEKIQNALQVSGSLAAALKETGRFPDFMTAYIKTGEETGCLDEVMASLAEHYEQESSIREQLRSAVTYPLIMLGMMGAVMILLLAKVLPVFQQVFHQMGLEMNNFSTGLLKIGRFFSGYTFLIPLAVIIVLIFAGLCFLYFGKGITPGKILQKLPFLRNILISLDYSRISQGICLGLRSGLDPSSSLQLALGMISQPAVISRAEDALKLLSQGELFEDALTRSGLYQGMEARLLRIGFHAGSAEEVMKKLSLKYQEDSAEKIANAISIAEPTIVIVLSLLVGLVLLSVMMPLLGILAETAM